MFDSVSEDEPSNMNAKDYLPDMTDMPDLPGSDISAPIWSKAVILTGGFWTSSMLLQRASGLIGMHAGRIYPLTAGVGLFLTGFSLLITQYNTDGMLRLVARNVPSYLSSSVEPVRGKSTGNRLWTWGNHHTHGDAKQAFLSLFLYMLLERRVFRTSLPSSLITTGVYASTPWHWHKRMPFVLAATGDVASAAQRMTIQKMGRIHGCHHCGSRQVLSSFNFIADHMPPTKQVKDMNARWYRRMSGIEAQQQLLPQCNTCFTRQGGAVRSGTHALVYHMRLRIWHMAPALAYMCLNVHLCKSFLQEVGMMHVLDEVAGNINVQNAAAIIEEWLRILQ